MHEFLHRPSSLPKNGGFCTVSARPDPGRSRRLGPPRYSPRSSCARSDAPHTYKGLHDGARIVRQRARLGIGVDEAVVDAFEIPVEDHADPFALAVGYRRARIAADDGRDDGADQSLHRLA